MKLLQRFLVVSIGLGGLVAIWHFAGDYFRNQTPSGRLPLPSPRLNMPSGQIIKESDLNTVKLSPRL